MSVVFPAPFSPSSARISPGWTVRSMWSFATRLPKLLVMPVSSSFTHSLLHDGSSAHPGGLDPARVSRSGLRRALRRWLDCPILDLGLDLRDLGLQRGR